jgi:hypothetical protein
MDDESENLHWHALNYRTAASQHAEEMWQALAACVERKIVAERERCAMACLELMPDDGVIRRTLLDLEAKILAGNYDD